MQELAKRKYSKNQKNNWRAGEDFSDFSASRRSTSAPADWGLDAFRLFFDFIFLHLRFGVLACAACARVRIQSFRWVRARSDVCTKCAECADRPARCPDVHGADAPAGASKAEDASSPTCSLFFQARELGTLSAVLGPMRRLRPPRTPS